MPQDQYPSPHGDSSDGDRTDPYRSGASPSGPASTTPIPQGPPAQPGYGPPASNAYGIQGPVDATTAVPRRRRSRSTLYAVPITAIVAAALASGSTYALTDHATKTAVAAPAPTIKLDPADYASGDSVNWSSTSAKVAPSVVSITVTVGQSGGDQGSGVVLDKSGDIVTNNHVVSAATSNPKGSSVQVTLSNNTTYAADIVGTDASTDLAVIRIKNAPKSLTPIALGSGSGLVVGQPVMAIGNPLGLSGTVTTGIVSALNRPVSTSESDSQSSASAPAVVTNAIQTSAAINPGNSGGALVSATGKLIGINSSIATLGQSSDSTSQSGNIGIGFAIPVGVVQNITGQLIKSGKAVHAQLGIKADTAMVSIGGTKEAAALVASVESSGAARSAGLRAGDFIVGVNGQQVVGSDSLVGFIRSFNVGQRVTLQIVRGGVTQSVQVTLGEASAN